MHDAYELASVLKLQVQIEAVTAYDDFLIIGTRQGHIIIYMIKWNEINLKHDVSLLVTKHFGKPIQQLEVIPTNKLVCLIDNVVCIYDIDVKSNHAALTLIDKAEQTKGATLFTLDVTTPTSLSGITTPVIRLCVAVKQRLHLFYWKSNQLHSFNSSISLSYIPKTIAWCQESICVGFKTEYKIYTLDGKIKELFPTSSNRSSEPCVTKISNSTFALGRDNQTVLVNTQGISENKKAMKWSDSPIAVAWDDPYALGIVNNSIEVHTIDPCESVQVLSDLIKPRSIVLSKQGLLYVASLSQVWCLQAIDVTKQRQHLLANKQFQLALKLTELSKESEYEKKQKRKQIQTLYAHDLFQKKQFKQSMKEFIKLQTDLHEVIRLFPDLLPQTSKVNDFKPANDVVLKDKDLETGLIALTEYLTEVRHILQAKDDKANVEASSSDDSDSFGRTGKNLAQLFQTIDTTLLKCYLHTNDALVASLLRLENCHFGETEKTLKKHQKWAELIILYQKNNQHKKALELLQKQATEQGRGLEAYESTIQYLQHLGPEHIDIILAFADWVLKDYPQDGLKIFTDEIIEEVVSLPRPKVLDYLLRRHKDLVIPYLEHIIDVWKDQNAIFHNALVHQYREQIKDLSATGSPVDKVSAALYKKKLLQFLDSSSLYTPEVVVLHFTSEEFLEERAIILGKLGKHEEAIAIYIQIIGDVAKGVEFCDKISAREKKDPSVNDVYVTLIKLLLSDNVENSLNIPGDLKPLKKVTPDEDKALELLNKYATKINPCQILSVLPDHIPLNKIRHFLETSLRSKLSERRRLQILKGLLNADHLQIEELRMLYESQKIVIDDSNVCLVCKKRFGNQSAFVRYPNGDIVHYSCQNRK